jgi:DNA repair exonuclease SbcCD ATPase subunit
MKQFDLHFISLVLQNFMSFGNSPIEVNLSEPGTILVEGVNLDKGGSNGSGKTTILNAICYALFNKPFDNISLQRLINNTNATKNTKMEVSLTFIKSGIEYTVTRVRGETNNINITRDGEDITPGKGVTECDAMIQDIIGISFELFVIMVIFSGSSSPFLDRPIAQQRNLIEELFNISMLSERAVKLKELIRATETDIKVQEAIIKQQQIANELHVKQIKDAENRILTWESQRQDKIFRMEHDLKRIGDIDFVAEQALHQQKAELTAALSSAKQRYKTVMQEHHRVSTDLDRHLFEGEKLKNSICPYCEQHLASAKEKLAITLGKIDQMAVQFEGLSTNAEALKTEVQRLESELNEVTSKIKHQDLISLLSIRENSTLTQTKLDELRVAVNPHTEALQALMEQEQVKVQTEEFDALKRRQEHQQFLLKLLTSKDSFVRRRILNSLIPYLNQRLNFYATILGLPHRVTFNPDLSCTLSEYGRELDFGNLSNGEKKRVNIAMALAFRNVTHKLHMSVNLFFVDELEGGALDTPGIDGIIKILKDLARDEDMTVFVISHSPQIIGRLDRTMTVTKQFGFSTIS